MRDEENVSPKFYTVILHCSLRRTELLTEMHEKLSEAVKLYDKHLTAQLSHPQWRAAPSVQPSYTPQYQQPASQYGQWSIPPQATPASPPMQNGQLSYYTPERQPVMTNDTPVHVQPISQPGPSTPDYNGYAQPYNVASPPPVTIPQYTGYQVETPQSTPIPVQSPPPAAQVQQYQVPIPRPPTLAPAAQPSTALLPQTSLARHNTVSSLAHPPQNKGLYRANTMSHAPQQLHQLQHTSVPQQLPNFPVAPTAAPQGYQAYSTPAPPIEEREALLIDL